MTPMFHSFGLQNLFSAVARDQTLVIMPKYDETLYLSALQNYKVGTFVTPATPFRVPCLTTISSPNYSFVAGEIYIARTDVGHVLVERSKGGRVRPIQPRCGYVRRCPPQVRDRRSLQKEISLAVHPARIRNDGRHYDSHDEKSREHKTRNLWLSGAGNPNEGNIMNAHAAL